MKKKNEIPRRTVLTDADKETMMAVLIRNLEVFELFKDTLKAKDFGDANVVYAAIWQLLQDYHAEFGKLPNRSILKTGLATAIENDPEMLMDDQQGVAEGIIETAFDDKGTWDTNLSESEDHAEWAIKTVKKFQQELIAAKVRATIQTPGWIRADLPNFLETARHETEEVAAIGVSTAASLFPDGWDQDGGINTFSTGVDFLDVALKGGHAPGEVYGVLGPFASCKTTLAVMLAVEGCRQAAQILKETGEHQYVFLASFEAGLPELRIRTLSYAAKIERSSLEHMGQQGLAFLSTAKHLRPYEETLFATALEAGQKVLGERGRAKLAMKMLAKHLIILDMTGGDEQHRGAGSGYIAEIASRIKAELRGRGPDASCRLAIIDYVGAMAKRHLAVANKDVERVAALGRQRPVGGEKSDRRQVRLPGLADAPDFRHRQYKSPWGAVSPHRCGRIEEFCREFGLLLLSRGAERDGPLPAHRHQAPPHGAPGGADHPNPGRYEHRGQRRAPVQARSVHASFRRDGRRTSRVVREHACRPCPHVGQRPCK